MGNSSGMVYPPCMRKGKEGRDTNQLQFMKNVVLKAVWKHPQAWPFHAPVNSIRLGIPDYHDVIKTPMDLGTIEKRLQNHYYNDVSECIYDFTTIFVNCYVYNDSNDAVVKIAKELEKWFLVKIRDMPKEEKEFYRKDQASSKGRSEEDYDDEMDDIPSRHQSTKHYTKQTLMILNRLNS